MAKGNSDGRPNVDYVLPFDSEYDPRVCRSDDQEAQSSPHWAALLSPRFPCGVRSANINGHVQLSAQNVRFEDEWSVRVGPPKLSHTASSPRFGVPVDKEQ
jgi:hypothetical protein